MDLTRFARSTLTSRGLRKQDLAFIVVAHAALDLPNFLEAVESLGQVGEVILKSSLRNPHVIAYVQSTYRGRLRTDLKQHLIDGPRAEQLLKATLQRTGAKQVVIIDIGGYFAEATRTHGSALKACGLCAVVEDTENGHQRYESSLATATQSPGYPIYSVARNVLKDAEDRQVGISIVDAAKNIMSQTGGLINGMKVGVLGFGKIGQSIAVQAKRQGGHVSVYDCVESLNIKADSDAFVIGDRETILRESDILFCATGNQAIQPKDAALLKKGVYIASCTSVDSELAQLMSAAIKIKNEGENQALYQLPDGPAVHVFNGGNAVNFTQDPMLGSYIFGVQGLLLSAAARAIVEGGTRGALTELPTDYTNFVAGTWRRHFRPNQSVMPMSGSGPHDPTDSP